MNSHKPTKCSKVHGIPCEQRRGIPKGEIREGFQEEVSFKGSAFYVLSLQVALTKMMVKLFIHPKLIEEAINPCKRWLMCFWQQWAHLLPSMSEHLPPRPFRPRVMEVLKSWSWVCLSQELFPRDFPGAHSSPVTALLQGCMRVLAPQLARVWLQ